MSDLKGYAMVVGAAFFWGASATFAKHLLNQQLDTLLLVQTRVGFSFLVLLCIFAGFARHLLHIRPKDLWRFALLGVLGLAGANFTYYFTIKESTVATGITIQYTAPLFVMAYEVLKKEERFSLVKLLAAVMSLTGCFLAVTGFDLSTMRITRLGLLSGIGSVITFSFMTIYMRRLLVHYRVWTVTFYSIGFATLFWIILLPPWEMIPRVPDTDTWRSLVALALVSVLVPNVLFAGGLRFLVPSRVVITSTLEPVVAIATAAFFIGEVITPVQGVGAALVILAIMVLQVRRESGALPPADETEGR
jgi:drug/metabolite transporter (DMT)-like permease